MSTPKLRLGHLLTLAAALLLMGCAPFDTTGTQTQPAATSIAQTQPTPTPTPTPIPTCKANNIPTGGSITEPTIAPEGWTTFTDTLLHYTIKYPSNWIIPNGPCPGFPFDVWNHIPISASGAPALPPGGFYISVTPMPNPSQLSPAAFAQAAQPHWEDGGPPCNGPYTLTSLQVAGHDAVLATCPEGSEMGEGDPNQGYIYFVPDGTAMLTIEQKDLVNGQPSPVLAEMVNSITFTS
jgi:hypothetical protein